MRGPPVSRLSLVCFWIDIPICLVAASDSTMVFYLGMQSVGMSTKRKTKKKPRIVDPGEPRSLFREPPRPLGGYYWENDGFVVVPLFDSIKASPYDTIRFLNHLEKKGKSVMFLAVINKRFEKLLEFRGYRKVAFWAKEPFHCWSDGWIKDK